MGTTKYGSWPRDTCHLCCRTWVVREVSYSNNSYKICVTPTYSGCPAVKTFTDDIETCLLKNGIDNFKIELVYYQLGQLIGCRKN